MTPELLALSLADSGFGTFTGSSSDTIYVNIVPAKPDNCISILDFGGDTDIAVGECETLFQIRVRGTAGGRSSARQTVYEIANDYRTIGYSKPFTIIHGGETSNVVFIKCDVPYLLSWDEHGRPEWAFRMRVRHSL